MARRLNIERRRKRVRQYTARRRRRSPVRRAFSYWWGTGLLLLLTFAVMGPLTARVLTTMGAPEAPEHYQLQPAGLRLVQVPAEAIAKAVRQGSVKRQTAALDDAEIGLSLAAKAPEPAVMPVAPLSPMPFSKGETREVTSVVEFLPEADVGQEVDVADSSPVVVRMDAALEKAGFTLRSLPKPPAGSRGWVIFRVELDANGNAETVLREAPGGEETAWLRELRMTLAFGKGTRACRGFCHIIWKSKETL